jgi:hypothetical protein
MEPGHEVERLRVGLRLRNRSVDWDRVANCLRTGGHHTGPGRRFGSIVSVPGRIAQLARALPSHGRGHRFESCCAHCNLRCEPSGLQRFFVCRTALGVVRGVGRLAGRMMS